MRTTQGYSNYWKKRLILTVKIDVYKELDKTSDMTGEKWNGGMGELGNHMQLLMQVVWSYTMEFSR